MSVYNSEAYLSEAIESILNQTYTNFEFLIIDDNSWDGSYEILKNFAGKDSRILLFKNEENKGLTKNLNFLLKKAKGKYIARMDADDISLPVRFEKQVNFLENHPEVDIVGNFSLNINEKDENIGVRKVPVTHYEITKLLPKLNPMSHPTVMYRKNSIVKVGGYDERFHTSQDYNLWFKAQALGLKFFNIPEVLFLYRMNDDYTSRKSFKYRWNEFKIKINGYKLIKYPYFKYYNALISLGLAFIPPFLFKFVKKLDPR
jgi:glycosyltransferase involved in cell wall biosynthesis